MWELAACVDGVNFANGAGDEIKPPTDQEFDDMLARYNASLATAH